MRHSLTMSLVVVGLALSACSISQPTPEQSGSMIERVGTVSQAYQITGGFTRWHVKVGTDSSYYKWCRNTSTATFTTTGCRRDVDCGTGYTCSFRKTTTAPTMSTYGSKANPY